MSIIFPNLKEIDRKKRNINNNKYSRNTNRRRVAGSIERTINERVEMHGSKDMQDFTKHDGNIKRTIIISIVP